MIKNTKTLKTSCLNLHLYLCIQVYPSVMPRCYTLNVKRLIDFIHWKRISVISGRKMEKNWHEGTRFRDQMSAGYRDCGIQNGLKWRLLASIKPPHCLETARSHRERQAYVIKERAWLTKPLPCSATQSAELPKNSVSHATPDKKSKVLLTT